LFNRRASKIGKSSASFETASPNEGYTANKSKENPAEDNAVGGNVHHQDSNMQQQGTAQGDPRPGGTARGVSLSQHPGMFPNTIKEPSFELHND
jgi:hypothetical protein